jgi:N-acetylglucosaminyldiphosphoundecaprenol N-acetyl-beta-D-mannosaminyltransferase
LIGVGAAFDFHSGRVRQAPRWMQRSGLEWFFRLCTEPRRLGPRYLKTNPRFALRACAQLTGLRRYPLD